MKRRAREGGTGGGFESWNWNSLMCLVWGTGRRAARNTASTRRVDGDQEKARERGAVLTEARDAGRDADDDWMFRFCRFDPNLEPSILQVARYWKEEREGEKERNEDEDDAR